MKQAIAIFIIYLYALPLAVNLLFIIWCFLTEEMDDDEEASTMMKLAYQSFAPGLNIILAVCAIIVTLGSTKE